MLIVIAFAAFFIILLKEMTSKSRSVHVHSLENITVNSDVLYMYIRHAILFLGTLRDDHDTTHTLEKKIPRRPSLAH